MRDLIGWIVKSTAAPKIIHSIPGRIRIKVPHLKYIPVERRLIEQIVNDALNEVEGFQSLEISFVTSTLLIRYDRELIDQERLLSYLTNLVEQAIVRRKYLIESVRNGSLEDFVKELVSSQKSDKIPDKKP